MPDRIVRFAPDGLNGEGLELWDEIPPASLESGRPVQHGRYYYLDKARGLSCGAWTCTAMTSKLEPYPVHEFMIVLEGAVTIREEGGRSTTVRAGESFLLPKGLRCQWHQEGFLRKYFVILDDAALPAETDAAKLHAHKVDTAMALPPSTPPTADLLFGAVPAQHGQDVYRDASGRWLTGVWETTPYHRKLIPFPRHELMHLLEGTVTFTDETGQASTFTAGDTLFVPLGAMADWNGGDLRKIYCILKP